MQQLSTPPTYKQLLLAASELRRAPFDQQLEAVVDWATQVCRDFEIAWCPGAISLLERLRVVDESHDLGHHLIVAGLTLCVSSASKFVRETAFWAALVHDVVDHKYSGLLPALDRPLEEIIGRASAFCVLNSSYSKEAASGRPAPPDWAREESVRRKAEHKVEQEVMAARDILASCDRCDAISIARCEAYTRARQPDATEYEIRVAVVKHALEKLCWLWPRFIVAQEIKAQAAPFHAEVCSFIDEAADIAAKHWPELYAQYLLCPRAHALE